VEVLMFLQMGSLTLLFPFLPLHMKERGFTVSQVTFFQEFSIFIIRCGLGIFGNEDSESALVQKNHAKILLRGVEEMGNHMCK
jgi:hypothetical protein